jgi:hypothetical protein
LAVLTSEKVAAVFIALELPLLTDAKSVQKNEIESKALASWLTKLRRELPEIYSAIQTAWAQALCKQDRLLLAGLHLPTIQSPTDLSSTVVQWVGRIKASAERRESVSQWPNKKSQYSHP